MTTNKTKVSLLHIYTMTIWNEYYKHYECSHLEIQTVFGPFWTTQLDDFLLWQNNSNSIFRRSGSGLHTSTGLKVGSIPKLPF